MKKNLMLVLVCCLMLMLVGCGQYDKPVFEKPEEKVVERNNWILQKPFEEMKPVEEEKPIEKIQSDIEFSEDDKFHYNETFDLKFYIPKDMTISSKEDIDKLPKGLDYEFQGFISNDKELVVVQIATKESIQFAMYQSEERMIEDMKEGFKQQEGYVDLGEGDVLIGKTKYHYFDMYASSDGIRLRLKMLFTVKGNKIMMIALTGVDENSLNKMLQYFN